MPTLRIALANTRLPTSRDESVKLALETMEEASRGTAAIVCFPECFVPGYRIGAGNDEPPDQAWLEAAWASIDAQAAALSIGVILGTERMGHEKPLITARVTNSDGSLAGFQDKVQLDPSEEATYAPGVGRRIFQCGELLFGIVICHEGWRYPETVRWAARHGAHVVFHPHFELVEDKAYQPTQFADPKNTFHEKAALCRAAENTCYFATINCALPGSTTTSAVIDPEGNLLAHQTHGKPGVLFANIEPAKATGLLAKRFKPNGLRATGD